MCVPADVPPSALSADLLESVPVRHPEQSSGPCTIKEYTFNKYFTEARLVRIMSYLLRTPAH